MAIPKIKATYSLDTETVELLEQLARKWETSKSDALRRLIREGATTPTHDAKRKIAALERAQRAAGLTPAGADAWIREVRAERRAFAASRRN